VRELLSRGNHARATSATKLNASSSRSHAVFTLHLQQEMVTKRSRHHAATAPPARGGRGGDRGGASPLPRAGSQGGERHGPGGPLPAMGAGGRGPLEAWTQTANPNPNSNPNRNRNPNPNPKPTPTPTPTPEPN